MKRVTGIGGVSFLAKDPVPLRAWYKRHVSVDLQSVIALFVSLSVISGLSPTSYGGSELGVAIERERI